MHYDYYDFAAVLSRADSLLHTFFLLTESQESIFFSSFLSLFADAIMCCND
jgi:hypothetical protein